MTERAKQRSRQDAPYEFPVEFERAVAFLACTDPHFLSRTAHEVRPELMADRGCTLAVECAQQALRERGQGPRHAAEVIGAAARRRDAGKLTHEDVRAVSALFDAFDGREPSVEGVEAELVATLNKRLRFEAARIAVDEHATGEGWPRLHDVLRRIDGLGRVEGGSAIVMEEGQVRAALARLRSVQRQPLGIAPLDALLGGGTPYGTLTCFMAGPGDGKSMAMSHITGQASARGLLAAYATLELPPEHVMVRVLANQSGVTIDEILSGAGEEDALRWVAQHRPVPVAIRDFTPHVTTAAHVTEWAEEVARKAGRPLDILVVDYADKLTSSGKLDDKGMYGEMRVVYETLRIYCERHHILGVTASQSRARDEKRAKRIDIEHVADSMHKARVVDLFVTLNRDEETNEIEWFLAKNRYGVSRVSTPPTPCCFAMGQVAPVIQPRVVEAAVRLGADERAASFGAREPGCDDAPAAGSGQPEGVPF